MKELSIEQKAEAYDKAIENMRKFRDALSNHEETDLWVLKKEIVTDIEYYFPELKESEDEKMWKLIKKYAHYNISDIVLDTDHITREQLESWIEKQGESDETKAKMFLIKKGYPIDANGTFPTYKEMCNTIRERLKKIAETCVTICDPDAYRIGFVDGEAHAKEEMTTAYSEEDDVRRRSTIQVLKYARSLDTYNQYGKADIDKNISWLEKHCLEYNKEEHNNLFEEVKYDGCVEKARRAEGYNIVKPKFNIDDWIVHKGTKNVYKVVAIINNKYQLKYGDNYTVQKCADVDRCSRLWDINKDAKDGDVLAVTMYPEGIWIGIFKEQNGCTFSSHCFVNTEGTFKLGTYNHGNGKAIHPATKEQRDTLEKAMSYAGYTFDFEKKELKKIEQIRAKWSEEAPTKYE